ncbi:bifunctional alpha/beta hydrolase/OsmC family protein [Sphingomonas sp. BGYR3]|uniref:bifunctional alpha/beta hydrolase/OsmC family protein n=1 Tax=Sphingomonas sp. BGYR3 TaxID=2975483 RepID=UPI0021A7C855|nr:bifunctional alpha/beta hydrolase/OsmC family protein [Sphingomonas sp. BGYR3]MDG5487070.1 bifunctional alpha/beta hydrolase/OsmC family protein [Sphingomonas sp. BGYR3]
MATRTVRFAGASGAMLAASIEMPIGPVRAIALFAHCFTCTMRSHAATRISTALAAQGIATMRFDFTGLGGSEGTLAEAGFAADVEDLVAAADYLDETLGAPSILIGHSLGGAAVLAAAARIPSVLAVATIAAPFDPAHVLHRIDGDLAAIERDGAGPVTIAGRQFTISRKFIHGVRDTDPAASIAALGRALLVLHSPTDELVGIDNARQIYEAARHPKSFVTLDRADHLLTDRVDAAYVATIIAAWAMRYLPVQADPVDLEPGEVLVGNGDGRFGTSIRTRDHHWLADEPEAVGGENAAPGPYDLLLGALGACTSMTVKLIADREGIPLEQVTVRLRHERNHEHDSEMAPADPSARMQAIWRTLSLHGTMTREQRQRLIEVADKCPVHRTLTGELHIHTDIAD